MFGWVVGECCGRCCSHIRSAVLEAKGQIAARMLLMPATALSVITLDLEYRNTLRRQSSICRGQ